MTIKEKILKQRRNAFILLIVTLGLDMVYNSIFQNQTIFAIVFFTSLGIYAIYTIVTYRCPNCRYSLDPKIKTKDFNFCPSCSKDFYDEWQEK